MNGLYCYPVQQACVSREKKIYEYCIPEILLTYLRTHDIGLNGRTRSKILSGWLCITQNLKQQDRRSRCYFAETLKSLSA